MKLRVDTAEMSYEEVNALVQDLRAIRARKGELKRMIENFRALVSNSDNMVLVNKHTGEVLNPNEWELFDELTHSFYHEKGDE